MLVLRKDQSIRERAEARTHSAEDGACNLLTGYPEIRGGDRPSALDDRVSEADLLVQFERACLHGKCARRGPRLRRLIDDPDTDAQPRQPQGQHQARRPCANNEDVGVTNRRCIHRLRSFSNLARDE